MVHAVRQFFAQVADIIYPRWCVGCGTPDVSLCDSCTWLWHRGPWWRAESGARYLLAVDDQGDDLSIFPVWARAWYSGSVASALVRWKNMNDCRVDAAFAQLVADIVGDLQIEDAFPAAQWPNVVVVPVASHNSRRRAGRFVAGVIGRSFAQCIGVDFVDALRAKKSRRGGGNVAERGRKSRAQRAVKSFSGYDVILVDDVLTTGATLLGAQRAVSQAGGRVVGAVVLAVTDRP
ncbi:ComF family protein [Arcanobacterium buesumense]|uniref:ComF family protein n=1 Tax=Arcanobacterium buesumense TaxID=2722751 RepID=UPI001B3A97F7|nr:phosphoribosyltransferase [Arcanobacterium buesumense]